MNYYIESPDGLILGYAINEAGAQHLADYYVQVMRLKYVAIKKAEEKA